MLLNSSSLRLLLQRDKKRTNRPSSAATDVQQLVHSILEEETSRYHPLEIQLTQ